jgi:transposase
MPAPRKYPAELRERSQRLVSEAMAEDPSLSMNQAVLRIGPMVGLVPAALRRAARGVRQICR